MARSNIRGGRQLWSILLTLQKSISQRLRQRNEVPSMSAQQGTTGSAHEEPNKQFVDHGKDLPTNQIDSDDSSSIEDVDGDYGSYGNHIFSDPKVAEYWRNVYETATYEGRHRFDPTFTWSATEEKRLKRKASFDYNNGMLWR